MLFLVHPYLPFFVHCKFPLTFVRSNASLYGGSCGNRAKINLATRSVSSENSDMNLCILRSDDSALASHSKLHASFSKQTVCTLHNALINKPKNLIRARFILSPKNSFSVSDKTVTLLLALIFIVGNGIGSTIPTYCISRFYPNNKTCFY